MTGSGPGSIATRAAGLAFAVAAAGMVWQVFVHATQPGDFVVKHLVLDDAVYYAVPARHFVEGSGYSFDGIHRTNGVQPLWAMVVTLLAALVRDDLTLLRTTALLSGLLWLTGGVILFRFLRPFGSLASFAAVGFLVAGLEMRLGLSGMENGLQVTLLALLLHAWRRLEESPLDDEGWRRRALCCGLLLLGLCLNRIEFPVLAIPFGLRALALRRRREPWKAAALSLRPLVLPPALAVASWCVVSRIYFGDWTPVSGSVKAFMAANTPNLPSFLSGYLHHVAQVVALSLVPTVQWTATLLGVALETAVAVVACAFALPLLAALVAVARSVAAGVRRLQPRSWPGLLLGIAAIIHLGLVSKYLTMFTTYCTWYFAVDIFAVWTTIGIALGTAPGRAARLLGIPAVVLLLATGAHRLVFAGDPPDYPISATGNYVEAGRWAQQWLPPGRKLGAFNAGYISMHAASHTVVNLDGLMNDGTYLREYYAKNRVDDYIRDERIEYLVDCLPIPLWQSYDQATVVHLPKNMVPIHCEPMADGFVFGVLAVPGIADRSGERSPPHPLANVHWDAIVRGRHAIVPTEALATLAADRQVASTVLAPGTRVPLHVVTDRAAARTAVDAAGFTRLPPLDLDFGGKVRLVAAEVPPDGHRRGSTVLVRTYWRAEGLTAEDRLEFGAHVGIDGTTGGFAEQWHAPAFGTLPAAEWPRGTVIAQAFAVKVPDDARGPLTVAIAVRNGGKAVPAASRGEGPVRVGAIQVEPR